jgi:hypothetical protein
MKKAALTLVGSVEEGEEAISPVSRAGRPMLAFAKSVGRWLCAISSKEPAGCDDFEMGELHE